MPQTKTPIDWRRKKKKTWVMFRGLNQEKQYPDWHFWISIFTFLTFWFEVDQSCYDSVISSQPLNYRENNSCNPQIDASVGYCW